ncbi:MAG: hypothetical protein R3C18_03855 [Planctomycetaceae bacterium]
MSRVDLHNVYLFLVLIVPLAVIRFTSGRGLWYGVVGGSAMIVVLTGCIVTRGNDIRRHHPDRYLAYFVPNIIFNIVTSFLTFGMFTVPW